MKLATAGMVLFGMTAYAHHSLDASYDLKQDLKLEGRISNVLIRNPHSFLVIQVADKGGSSQKWAIEWNSARVLGKQGVQIGTLKAGDQVTFIVHPARKVPETRGVLEAIYRASDGFDWAVKTQPKKH
jgi:hypothetical protein